MNAVGSNGGTWNSYSGYHDFSSQEAALAYGIGYNNYHNSWGHTEYGSGAGTEFAYIWAKTTGSMPTKATVNYWMNRRNDILSQARVRLIASLRGDPGDDVDVLGILKKAHFVALRMALHLPDAISIAGSVESVAIFGGVVSKGTIKLLTGNDRGSSIFVDSGLGFGIDGGAGVTISEYYFMNLSGKEHGLTLGDFQGVRFSLGIDVNIGILSGGMGGAIAPINNDWTSAMYILGVSYQYGLGIEGLPVNGSATYGSTTLYKKN
jgi:hypothetical protein